jgi:hypothetical protein
MHKAVLGLKGHLLPLQALVTKGGTCSCANPLRPQDTRPKLAVPVDLPVNLSCYMVLPFPLGELWLRAALAAPAFLVAVAVFVAAQEFLSADLLDFVTPMRVCAYVFHWLWSHTLSPRNTTHECTYTSICSTHTPAPTQTHILSISSPTHLGRKQVRNPRR